MPISDAAFIQIMVCALWLILALKILSEGFESRRLKQLHQEIAEMSQSHCPNCCAKSTENEATVEERQQSS